MPNHKLKLIFVPHLLSSGEIWPDRWWAGSPWIEGKQKTGYAIARYTFCSRRSMRVKPYFRAYRYPGGVSIDGKTKYTSRAAAIESCKAHFLALSEGA